MISKNRDPADEFADAISESGIDDPGNPDPDPNFRRLSGMLEQPISHEDLSNSANTASGDYNWRKSPSLKENEFIPVDPNKYPILKYKPSGGKKRKTNKKSRKSKKSRKFGKQTKKHRKSKK
jgi:hypothetical protein